MRNNILQFISQLKMKLINSHRNKNINSYFLSTVKFLCKLISLDCKLKNFCLNVIFEK